jgi:phosphoglycerate kinase
MGKHKLPLITDVEDLKGKYVFVRSALNVPIADGKVRDWFRIIQSLPTIQYLVQKGARVIVCSHLGKDGKESIAPVYEVLKQHVSVILSSEVTGPLTTRLKDALNDGEVLLLENVRKDAREMENDVTFAKELASLAEIFVNDDFAASHRAHSSLHAICQFLPSYVGINFSHEYEELSKALNPVSPSLFILGGAKFETKMPLVEKFLALYDHVFIAGALANDFFKAKGLEVGISLVSDMSLAGSPLLSDPKVLLPLDVTAVKNGVPRITKLDDVAKDESILDVGMETMVMLKTYIDSAKTILWNGPLGNYEGGFQEQTLTCARLVAASDAYSVIGGGDTVASIESLNNQEQYGFLSTAGGAMLTFLELGSLPALDTLLEHSK